MIGKLKFALLALILLFTISGTALAADSDDPNNNPLYTACQSNKDTRSSAVCQQAGDQKTKNPIAGPDGIISKAANIIALITGVGAVIMIMISGFMFVTAGGGLGGQRSSDPNRAKTARSTLVAAIVGLVIIALAWSIVRLVTDRVIN